MGGGLIVAAAFAALLGGGAGGAGPVRVGVTASIGAEQERSAFVAAFRGRIEGPDVAVVEGCDGVTFCVTAVVAPVRLGRREGGRAVATYVTRRLLDHPNWPWAPPAAGAEGGPASPVTIVDAFTAAGDVSCVACEREIEALRREVGVVRAVTGETMVDEGDLQVHVGPGTADFLVGVAAEVAAGVLERHVAPWRASRAGR